MGMMGKILFVLWCLSWLPTLVGMLSEGPGRPSTPRDNAIRLICAGNAAAFYFGGGLWLGRRCGGHSGTKVVFAWLVFVCLNMWGPVVLAICGSVLGRPAPDE